MYANRYRLFHSDVQSILIREIESPFATLGYHGNIQIGVLRIPIVQYNQRELFALLHVVHSVKNEAGTRRFSPHRYPIDYQVAFDEVVTREFMFVCSSNVEH